MGTACTPSSPVPSPACVSGIVPLYPLYCHIFCQPHLMHGRYSVEEHGNEAGSEGWDSDDPSPLAVGMGGEVESPTACCVNRTIPLRLAHMLKGIFLPVHTGDQCMSERRLGVLVSGVLHPSHASTLHARLNCPGCRSTG